MGTNSSSAADSLVWDGARMARGGQNAFSGTVATSQQLRRGRIGTAQYPPRSLRS